ncbi:MAG: ABC transporter substrate-binding protein [Alphaproteobacteria bacterium]|nr:ABC transporter substrate-binding protein [Alphaproteobacteria bacterium]
MIRILLVLAVLFAAATGAAAAEISDGAVKIGLILDLSGPYSENTGQGSVAAAKMAVADFGGKVLGAPIEVLVEDHHNSADQAAAIARDWFDHKGIDAILDVTGSSEALIVQRIGDVRHKIVSLSGPGADRLTNEACTATSIHYVFDTYSIAHTVGSALVDRGEKTWFFITVDYSFGYDLERDTVEVVTAKGGEVVGRARHPLDTADFSSYLARAQQSKAQVIGLANAGGDMTNTIKQAKKLGMIPGPQTFAAMSLRITGVHALGLDTTQGLTLGESFYWDLDDATRAWSKRFFDIVGKMPNSLQAGLYSSVTHYLQAVKTAGTDATDPVMGAMKATPIDDFFARGGHIRADGLMVHDTRLFQVKAPSESKYPWDYLKLVATIPADQAFPPLSQSKCPLVKQ